MLDRTILIAVSGLPFVMEGDDVGFLINQAVGAGGETFEDDDIVVVAQKIISRAEGTVVNLADVSPSTQATELAQQTGRDARLCQVYIDESSEILSVKGRMVITRHRLGFIGSGSGVDRSNIAPHDYGVVVLLPRDPDGSARRVRQSIMDTYEKRVAVVVNDSMGRADRDGSVGMAIGIAGISHLEHRSQTDLCGNPSHSRIALVDEVSAAASLLMGQADEGVPVVVVRGVKYTTDENATIRSILNK